MIYLLVHITVILFIAENEFHKSAVELLICLDKTSKLPGQHSSSLQGIVCVRLASPEHCFPPHVGAVQLLSLTCCCSPPFPQDFEQLPSFCQGPYGCQTPSTMKVVVV